jgi:hypothetical protein
MHSVHAGHKTAKQEQNMDNNQAKKILDFTFKYLEEALTEHKQRKMVPTCEQIFAKKTRLAARKHSDMAGDKKKGPA